MKAIIRQDSNGALLVYGPIPDSEIDRVETSAKFRNNNCMIVNLIPLTDRERFHIIEVGNFMDGEVVLRFRPEVPIEARKETHKKYNEFLNLLRGW